jgi:integrase
MRAVIGNSLITKLKPRAKRSANRKNGKDDLRRLKVNYIDDLGDSLLSELTPMHVERWRTKRINNGVKPATVNRDIVILKSALTKAIEWGLIVAHPLKNLKSFKTDSIGKVRFLEKHEERRLKESLLLRNEYLKEKRDSGNQWRNQRGYICLPDFKNHSFADRLTPMVFLSLNTGLRRGELFSLDWSDVNFDRALLTVKGNTAKSGKTRHIPLNSIALQTLEDWRRQNQQAGLVFLILKQVLPLAMLKEHGQGY